MYILLVCDGYSQSEFADTEPFVSDCDDVCEAFRETYSKFDKWAGFDEEDSIAMSEWVDEMCEMLSRNPTTIECAFESADHNFRLLKL